MSHKTTCIHWRPLINTNEICLWQLLISGTHQNFVIISNNGTNILIVLFGRLNYKCYNT